MKIPHDAPLIFPQGHLVRARCSIMSLKWARHTLNDFLISYSINLIFLWYPIARGLCCVCHLTLWYFNLLSGGASSEFAVIDSEFKVTASHLIVFFLNWPYSVERQRACFSETDEWKFNLESSAPPLSHLLSLDFFLCDIPVGSCRVSVQINWVYRDFTAVFHFFLVFLPLVYFSSAIFLW